METKLQPSITGTRVNLIKGASQKDINDNTNLTKQYMDETKAYRDEANIINNSIAILNDETIYNADMAYKWSSNPIEVEVTTGKYSAYHWAYKANEAANIAINIIDDINMSTLKSYSNSKVNDLLGDKAFLNNPKFTNHISFGNSILSNWAGSLKVIEANGSTFFGSNGISALTGSNAYYDGNWRYKTDGSAGLQLVNQGSHQFRVAASGLSNDIISWNTILTVDNNGVNSDSLVNKTSQTGSIIMPSSSTLNRDNVPLDGYARHNTTLKNLEYYGNSKWNIITDNLKIVNSVSELKLLDGNVYVNCIVNGYYIKGDGGGGNFYWDSTSTEVDNGGTIIQATGVTTGRWKRVFSGAVNAKWFGAKGDGVTDDTLAIQNTINAGTMIFIPDGVYKITSPLNVPSGKRIKGTSNSDLNNAASANCIIHKVTNTVDSQGLDAIFAVHNNIVHPDYAPSLDASNVFIENITLVGNNATSTLAVGYGGATDNNTYGIFVGAGENFYFSDITIVNCTNALYMQQVWLSQVDGVLAYGRIAQLGGTSTIYSSCEAGYNTLEGYRLENCSYINMNSCASDGGGYGRYIFKNANGIVLNACAIENINQGLRPYDYTGLGMYIQALGGCEVTFNSFRAFDYIAGNSEAPTDFITYISATTDDKLTFITDSIDRQLPPHTTSDKAYKIFGIDNNAEIQIINAKSYLGGQNFFRTQNMYSNGATLLQIENTRKETITPSFLTGGTNTTTYSIRKGYFNIQDGFININIHIYIRSKNGTGNITISGLPAKLVTDSVQIPVQIANFSGVYVAKGSLDSTGVITLFNAETSANITDANVPANPYSNVWINAVIGIGQ